MDVVLPSPTEQARRDWARGQSDDYENRRRFAGKTKRERRGEREAEAAIQDWAVRERRGRR
jgi:hypothetical protein